MLLRDLLADRHLWLGSLRMRRSNKAKRDLGTETLEMDDISSMPAKEIDTPTPSSPITPTHPNGVLSQISATSTIQDRTLSPTLPSPSNPSLPSLTPRKTTAAPPKTLSTQVTSLLNTLRTLFPTSTHTLFNLPLPLLPFAFSMFTLVEALQSAGWIEIFASWWSRIQERTGGQNAFGSVLVMVFLSSALCNVSFDPEFYFLQSFCCLTC